MAQRDYAVEPKKKGNVKISKVLATIAVISIIFGLGLWLLKENTPTQPIPNSAVQPPVVPKSELPSRPDEVYSYIRDLETREVPLDKRVDAQLNAEQERKLKEEEERRKQEEQLRLAAEQKAQEPQITITETAQTPVQPVVEQPKQQTSMTKVEAREATPEEIAAAKKVQEQKALEKAKLAEEKRKQELKKQQELAKKAEQEKANVAKLAEQQKTEQLRVEQSKAEQLKAEKAKAEQAKKVEQAKPQKVVAVAAKPNEQASNQAGRFGLQCGAFKNKAQAENMQARLAMAGYNARIASSGDWNRVFIGPVGDRSSASSAQSNARSVAECVIISM